MEHPFQPKGEVAEWRLIYDALLSTADFDDVITYEQLDDVLGRTFVEKRFPLYRARRELGDARQRWLEAVPNVGYRVIRAGEHVRVSRSHKQRGRKQIQMALRVVEVTDLTALSPGELIEFDTHQQHIAALWTVAFHHENRLRRIEKVLRADGKIS